MYAGDELQNDSPNRKTGLLRKRMNHVRKMTDRFIALTSFFGA